MKKEEFNLTYAEIEAIKKILYAFDLDAGNWENYYKNDIVTINKGRDGNNYVWLCDAISNEVLNIETGLYLTEEEIEEQFY